MAFLMNLAHYRYRTINTIWLVTTLMEGLRYLLRSVQASNDTLRNLSRMQLAMQFYR